MKKNSQNFDRFLLSILMMMVVTGCGRSTSSTAERKESPAPRGVSFPKRTIDYYTCSMHPKIRENHPGNCPLCGMTLTPVYVKDATIGPSHTEDEGKVRLSNEEIRQASVRTEAAEKRVLTKELLIFGSLGYDLNLHRDVVPLVEGRIERQWIDFNRVDVRQGDPLVVLYSPQSMTLQQEYLKALQGRWLSTFYERDLLDSIVRLTAEKLKRIGFTDDDLRRLQEEQKISSEIIVRSPITGTIVGNMVHLGEMAKTDVPLYHIVPLDELWFNAQVFEPDLGLLKIGQEVRITTKSFPGEVFLGQLAYIGRALDASNRTIPVRFKVPNKDLRLLPNLSANGQLEIPLGQSLLSVPNSAVLDLGTRHVVYVEKEKGVYLPRNVHVGHVTQHYTQILDGLEVGEKVVTSGAFLMDAQSQLRGGVTEETIPSPETSVMPSEHHH